MTLVRNPYLFGYRSLFSSRNSRRITKHPTTGNRLPTHRPVLHRSNVHWQPKTDHWPHCKCSTDPTAATKNWPPTHGQVFHRSTDHRSPTRRQVLHRSTNHWPSTQYFSILSFFHKWSLAWTVFNVLLYNLKKHSLLIQ